MFKKVSDSVGFKVNNCLGLRVFWRRVESVAAVWSGQECRGVLAFECGAVDVDDKLQQVNV